MTATNLRLAEFDPAARRLVFEPSAGEPMPYVHAGDTGVFIDQATCDRTLAFDAELVSVDATTASFCFHATGNRAGGRGLDFRGGDQVRLMMRHQVEPAGDGILAAIPGQHDVGHGFGEPVLAGDHPPHPGAVDREPLVTGGERPADAADIDWVPVVDDPGGAHGRLSRLANGAALVEVYGPSGRLSHVMPRLRADLTLMMAAHADALAPAPGPLMFTTGRFRGVLLDALCSFVATDLVPTETALLESFAWRVERRMIQMEAGDLGGAARDAA